MENLDSILSSCQQQVIFRMLNIFFIVCYKILCLLRHQRFDLTNEHYWYLEQDSVSLIFLISDSLYLFGFDQGNNGGNVSQLRFTPGLVIRSK